MSLNYKGIWKDSEKDELLDHIESYKTSGNEGIISSILEKYNTPLRDAMEVQRQANLKLLEDYPYCYTDGMMLPEVLPVWMDENEVIYFLPEKKCFSMLQRLNVDRGKLKRDTPIAVAAQFWVNDLLDYEARTALMPESRYLDMEIPMYLFYTAEEWNLLLQIADIPPLLTSKRIVFLTGKDNVRKCFEENGVIFPQNIYDNIHFEEYDSLIQGLVQGRAQRLEMYIHDIQEYYSCNENVINQRFEKGTPRILAITTRLSTAVQFHTRDSMTAIQRSGGETVTLIEKDPLHRVGILEEVKTVAEFKPDALFLIDHFRVESDPRFFPKEMFSITWVQDPLPLVMNPAIPEKLTGRDFIMNHYISWKAFFDVGYDKGQIIEAPIPANSYIYKPYEIDEQEREQYEADICLVCHAADVEGGMMQMACRFNEKERPMIVALYREYYRLAEKEVIYYKQEEFNDFVEKFFMRQYRISMSVDLKNMIAEHMRMYYNQAVLRQVIADWLIHAGLKNIKLWGNGWLKYEKYKPYAMGPAQNGETLSKIYQASKIVLGNNSNTTAAARAWESMLSGAFYMSNYIPPESDAVDIRKIINVGEDLVMFYNRKDLIKKVRYYLKHDEERREMARRGREVALQKMTYDALMKRVIQFIGDKLKERRETQPPKEVMNIDG